MKYDVTVVGGDGTKVITVEAETGDEAAQKAHKPGTYISGVTPTVADAVAPKAKAE